MVWRGRKKAEYASEPFVKYENVIERPRKISNVLWSGHGEDSWKRLFH